MALTAAQLAIAKQLVGYLSPPLPLNSAIAVGGNVGQECQFNPTEAGDGGVSKYWMQWQGTRLTNYLAWCTANKLTPVSPQAIQFFSYELPTPDGSPLIVPWLMDTSNSGQPTRPLKTLVADICQFYERAGTPDLDNRIGFANEISTFLVSNPLPSNPSTPPVTPPVIPPVTPPVIPPVALPNAQINANIAQVMIDLGTLLKSIQGL